jgi:glycogen(starch) synthase
VWSAHALRKRAGLQSRVLNVDTRAPASDAYIRISGGLDLLRQLFRHVYNDWALNVHTNGHNPKSWLIALICGVAAQFGPGATLTLHSGLVPGYLKNCSDLWRFIARLTCCFYGRIVCVSDEIGDVVASLGIPRSQMEIIPAFLPIAAPDVNVPEEIERWMGRRSPLITSTMFFRKEYGFELLVRAVAALRKSHPELGCLVMGSGEDREQAEALVEQHRLQDAMFLAGDLNHELCLALMARSSVFVRPTFRDGDSISVREAMALGVPVVASKVGTRPEGTLLFEAGDLDGLIPQIERVI